MLTTKAQKSTLLFLQRTGYTKMLEILKVQNYVYDL